LGEKYRQEEKEGNPENCIAFFFASLETKDPHIAKSGISVQNFILL
jgi:hypothetical protein